MNWSRLQSQSSQTILFLLGNRQQFNAMHMRLLVACERTLKAQGYDLIFTRHEYSGQLRPAEFSILEPALTSITLFEDQLGERLTTMLLGRIRDPKAGTTV